MARTSNLMDLFFQFKDFVTLHLGDLSTVLAVVFLSLLVLLFATREIVTWLARTRQIRNDLRLLQRQIEGLRSEIARLQSQDLQKLTHNSPQQTPTSPAVAVELPKQDFLESKEAPEFPLEPQTQKDNAVFKIY